MRDEQERGSLFTSQDSEAVEDLDLQRRVHVRDRLIEHDERRSGRQRPGEADALHLAAGELAGEPPDHGLVEPD